MPSILLYYYNFFSLPVDSEQVKWLNIKIKIKKKADDDHFQPFTAVSGNASAEEIKLHWHLESHLNYITYKKREARLIG